jgi:hypothetical protein
MRRAVEGLELAEVITSPVQDAMHEDVLVFDSVEDQIFLYH